MNLDDITIKHGNATSADFNEGCVMNWVALFAAQKHSQKFTLTDHPTCTNFFLTNTAIYINDRLNDQDRQQLRHFIPRLMQAKRTSDDLRINKWLKLEAAEFVSSLNPDPRIRACLNATKDYLNGLIPVEELRIKTNAAYAAAAYAAAADAAYAAAAYAAYAAAYAAADAAYAAAAYKGNSVITPIALLDHLLTYHEKLLADMGELGTSEFDA